MCAVARPSRWLPLRRPRSRLLNYDVVLNVELVVHIHDVYLDSLTRGISALGLIPVRLLLSTIRASVHIRWDYSLHMEELLVVLPALLVLHTGTLPTISLLLDVLGRMRTSHTTSTTTATGGLGWRLVLLLMLSLHDLRLVV